MLKRILKEPLIHFFAAGILVFTAFDFFKQNEETDLAGTIVVDGTKLVAFLQYRERLADPSSAEKMFDQLPTQEIQPLIDEFVKNEALFREAKGLKLDESDYPLRQRLIQQLGFINEGSIASSISFTETELQNFLDDNNEKYEVPATITFSHIFFNTESGSSEAARVAATYRKRQLNQQSPELHSTTSPGDPFPHKVRYAETTTDVIASHFGERMQKILFAMEPNDNGWQGPFESDHGWHIALINRVSPARVPLLSKIIGQVEQDALHARILEEKDKIHQSIVDRYVVEIGDLSTRTPTETERKP